MLKHLVDDILRQRSNDRKDPVSLREYEIWKSSYSFRGLTGVRYGQDFCNHFGFYDNLLYYQRDHQQADDYIIKNYVKLKRKESQ